MNYSKTFAINSQFSKFDMVVATLEGNKLSIKGKRLFAAVNKEEIVEVKIFHFNNINERHAIANNLGVYSQISSYLSYKLASPYFAAEILTWLESRMREESK